MPHTNYLLADRAGPPYRSQRAKVLPQRMQAGKPVHTAVPEKPLVLGYDEGLPENPGDIVQRPKVVDIPTI